MSCPEGQYFCNDRQKCMPIPKGKKVRKDGELVNEVAPPGWGHTKAEKEKTKPDKPKSKIGGTAAAFKRSLDRGDFKGLPGSKTKKEKTSDMFKLMWAMKNKGDKPHYKPGTDKKYKKYQDESVGAKSLVMTGQYLQSGIEQEKKMKKVKKEDVNEGRVARAVRDTIDKLPKGRLGGKRERIRQAAVNAEIRDKKSTEKGTTYKQWSDAVNAARERTEKKRKMSEQLAGDSPGIGLANLAIKGLAGVASMLHGLGGSQQRSPKPKSTPKPKVKLNKP